MKDNWPPERRAYYAQLIAKRRPWEKSSGPKSDEGKLRVSQNAYKHGIRGETVRRLKKALSLQRHLK